MKTKGIKIGYINLGSSVKLNPDKVKRLDGTLGQYKIINSLSKRKCIDKIYFLTRTDLDRISEEQKRVIDPRNIMVDLFKKYNISQKCLEFKGNYDNVYKNFQTITKLEKVIRSENIEFDFIIANATQGYHTSHAIPWIFRTSQGEKGKAKCLQMTIRYCSPALHYLNIHKPDWFLLATDVKYVKPEMKYKDTVHLPLEIIGQKNFDIKWTHHTQYEEEPEPGYFTPKEEIVKCTYSELEKVESIGEKIVDPESKKSRKITVVCAYRKDLSEMRFKMLEDYIINKYPEHVIMGNWPEEYQSKGNFDFVPLKKLDNIMEKTKYSLMMPSNLGWSTSKYVECIIKGVLPFFPPKYDEQNNALPENHFLKVNSPEELKQKIDYMEENDNERIELVRELQKTVLKGVGNGDIVIDMFNKYLEKHNIGVKLSKDSVSPKKPIKTLF